MSTFPQSRLSKCLSIQPIHGYDRVEIWLDRPELPVTQARLESECTSLAVSIEQMEQNPRWKVKLAFHQPTDECLKRLLSALGHDVAMLVTYVEIACDWVGVNSQQTKRWRNALLASVHVAYRRNLFLRYLTSWYCGPRSRAGVRRGHTFAVYADKPSKLHNARPVETDPPCLHIEWRASGSSAVASLSLISLEDLLGFDFDQFWENRLNAYALPKKTELGRLLAKASDVDIKVSDTAFYRRAQRWLERHSDKNRFVLHNGLHEKKKLARHLSTMSFWKWCESAIKH